MRRIATPTRQLNKFGPGRDGFTDGDPIAGIPSTDLEADWFDALQEEAAAIAEYGGVALDPNDNTQLLQGIQRLIAVALTSRPLICSILDLPTTNVGPIIVTECSEVWTWANTAFFTGYRSLLCGRPLDGHTAAPLASEVDAVGGLLPKVGVYAGLWGYAQEQSLVRTEAVWQANRGAHWFSDYSATQFRVPDLRDMFRRFTGTDLDTANARTVGSRQLQALLAHHHELSSRSIAVGAGGLLTSPPAPRLAGGGSRRIPADLRLGRSTSPTLLGFMFDVPFTANARTLATRQSDAMQNVVGSVGDIPGLVAVSSGPFSMQVAGSGGYGAGDVIYRRAVFDLSRSARTSTETRGANVAYHPESTPDVRLTANARTLASRQAPQIQSHAHNLRYSNTAGAVGGNQSVLDGGGALTYSTLTTGGTETRPVNAAYHPRVHA